MIFNKMRRIWNLFKKINMKINMIIYIKWSQTSLDKGYLTTTWSFVPGLWFHPQWKFSRFLIYLSNASNHTQNSLPDTTLYLPYFFADWSMCFPLPDSKTHFNGYLSWGLLKWENYMVWQLYVWTCPVIMKHYLWIVQIWFTSTVGLL